MGDDLLNDFRRNEAIFLYGEYDNNASLTPELDAEIELNMEIERWYRNAQ